MGNSVWDKIEGLLGKNLVIFCGAGISSNSGIPLSKSLNTKIINNLSSKLFAKGFKKIVGELPLEMLLGTLKENSDISAILNVFVSPSPNKNHLMISELARRGIVKTIITTNFDTLIEQSFEDSGLMPNRDYLVYSDEQDFSKYPGDSQDGRIKLIKIHGTIDKPDSIRTTMKQIANSLLSESRARVLRSVFKEPTANILVIGYSFSDNFDINPILLELDKPVSKVIVVHHLDGMVAKREKSGNKFEVSVSRILKNLDFEIIRADTNELTDSILKKLHVSTKINPPDKRESKWEGYIDSWSSQLPNPLRALLELELAISTAYIRFLRPYTGRLKRQLSKTKDDTVIMTSLNVLAEAFTILKNFKEAEYYLGKLGKFAQTYGNQVEFAFYAGMGNMSVDKFELNKARDWYHKAYELSVSIGDQNCMIQALKNLANLSLTEGKYESSLSFAKEASLIADRNGVQIEHNTYRGVGAAVFYDGSIDEAIRLRELALENSINLRQKQLECIDSVSLSNIYLWRHKPPSAEDFEKSLKSAINGLNLALEIGDTTMRAAAHMNLANNYFFQQKFKRAFWHIATSFLQASHINDPVILTATTYNLGIYFLLYLKHRNINSPVLKRIANNTLDQAFSLSKKYGISKQLEFYRKNLSEIQSLPKDRS
jgi:NAD-dependent SIR2 family protein deacetylase/tetratricopeptide (TPR) repeat protein